MSRLHLKSATVALALAVGLVSTAASQANQRGASAPINDTNLLAAGEACAFPVEVTFAGKLKSMQLSGQRITTIWPNLATTVTNLAAPERSITVRGSGTFHDSAQPDASDDPTCRNP